MEKALNRTASHALPSASITLDWRKRMSNHVAWSLLVYTAIQIVAKEIPDPLGTEMGMISDEAAYGRDMGESLKAMAERIGTQDLRFLAVAVSIQAQSGGNLADILDGLAKVIRARFKLFRRVKAITAIPISWRGKAIGAILLRTFRDGPAFSAADLQFCQVVANLTAKALRNAHRFEKLRQQRGENGALRRREREQAALIGFLRNLLSAYPPRAGLEDDPDLTADTSPEIGRLSGVAQAVLSQEAASR